MRTLMTNTVALSYVASAAAGQSARVCGFTVAATGTEYPQGVDRRR